MPCWEMMVSGRVQGVGFRWFVRDCAIKHSIHGYVRNEINCDVRIIAIGESEVLEQFAEEIKRGNLHAQVQQLLISELTNYTDYKDFFIA